MRFKTLIIATISLMVFSTVYAESIDAYFGTYTSGNNGSKGIYHSVLNTDTGELSTPMLAAEAKNPSFLEIHPNGRFLYAVSESGSAGTVSAYAIDMDTKNLKLLNSQPSGGSGPCHVNIDHTGKSVLVANYGSGSASVIPIKSDGSLAEPTCFVQHEGSSVNPQRQKGPHAHSVNISPDDRFAFVADLGLDKVMIYKLDVEKGTIIANDPVFAKVKPGSGPRHFTFSVDGKFAYVINEMGGTITVFSYEPTSGTLTEIQTISTLPDDFAGRNSCAEVRVHPSGKFLYGSNRGHDSIAVYRIDPTNGKLTFVEHEKTDIKTPRNFNIDPTGKFCLVANQDGNSVVVFKINTKTGALEPTGHKISMGKPVCIRFLQKGFSADSAVTKLSISPERRKEVCKLIISEHFGMRFSVEISGPLNITEVEKNSLEALSKADRKDIPKVPFGFAHDQWIKFKNKYKEGDELYYFRSDQKSWKGLYGRLGHAIIRNNKVVAVFVTLMS
jgi:6-phosphogluconolactonase